MAEISLKVLGLSFHLNKNVKAVCPIIFQLIPFQQTQIDAYSQLP